MSSSSSIIYQWTFSDNYPGYMGVTDADQNRIDWYDDFMGEPLPENYKDWTVPTLEQYLGEGRKKRKPLPIGDAPTAVQTNLISEKAIKPLKEILDKHASLYPVVLSDDPEGIYYMVVCRTIIDCLDRKASVGKLGRASNPEYFAHIDNWVFNKDCIRNNHMFVLPDDESSIFVSEHFKQIVVDSGLKGFCFKTEFCEESPFTS
jgi:hypothetical protein